MLATLSLIIWQRLVSVIVLTIFCWWCFPFKEALVLSFKFIFSSDLCFFIYSFCLVQVCPSLYHLELSRCSPGWNQSPRREDERYLCQRVRNSSSWKVSVTMTFLFSIQFFWLLFSFILLKSDTDIKFTYRRNCYIDINLSLHWCEVTDAPISSHCCIDIKLLLYLYQVIALISSYWCTNLKLLLHWYQVVVVFMSSYCIDIKLLMHWSQVTAVLISSYCRIYIKLLSYLYQVVAVLSSTYFRADIKYLLYWYLVIVALISSTCYTDIK